MRIVFLSIVFYIATCRAAVPFLHSWPPSAVQSDQHVLAADTASLVSESFRHARGFVSLGDSYSAGIGTGLDGDYLASEGDCRRGQHGYPLLLHLDLNNVTKSNTSMQWLSCTGARTKDILSGTPLSQVDLLNISLPLDFATLSVGGNDLGFFDVMNACIFRFYSFYSGTCEAALAASDAAIASDLFEQRLEIILQEILDKVVWEKRPRFTITVTGYARFFNDITPECDDMSLGVWYGGPKLSQYIRTRMNELVVATNAKLQRTVDIVNARFSGDRPKVLFVNYDTLFEGHRFCEPGVMEPAYDRVESWFFLVGGPDNARNKTMWPNGTNGDPEESRYQNHRQAQTILAPGSELVDPDRCLAHAQKTGDWGQLALCYMAMAKSRDPSLRPAYRGVVPMNGMWWVPTYYGKTFHPRSLGCEGIRDRIYEAWDEYGL
ncbi:hypothetical protein N0V93_005750 [Gnomoniopsis smithogilvyi]|uniref:SGNH hydrolase-type esterase domain-containing protein n=1 Tax=Gnomoniopsis smithogilvyi TaxID=1191159 RepID=A0A9W8YV00_9PEZI|nr:hypothetical protein N0V93_005750 [Gnomoniopsis smithogilvyi]